MTAEALARMEGSRGGPVSAGGGGIAAAGRLLAFLAMLAAAVALLTAAPALAQQAENFEGQLDQWEQSVADAEAALEGDFESSEPDDVEAALRQTVREVEELAGRLDSRIAPLRQQLESLGAAPAEGEAPEDGRIASLREELRSRIGGVEAQITEANLVRVRAQELMQDVASWQQAQRRQEILQRNPPPVTLEIWEEGSRDAVEVAGNVISAPLSWWEERHEAGNPWRGLGIFVGVPILGFLLGWPGRRWITRRFGRDPEVQDPSYARRIVAAIADGLANAIMPAAILGLTVVVLSFFDLLTGLFATLVYSLATAGAMFLMVTGLARASLSPQLTAWRILPVQPDGVWSLLYAIRSVVAVLAVSLVLLIVAYTSGLFSTELESIFFLIQTSILAVLLAWVLRPSYWVASVEVSQTVSEAEQTGGEAAAAEAAEQAEPDGRDWLDTARGLLRLFVVLMPLLALVGYSRLAYFLQSRMVLTATLIGFAMLARLAAREFIDRLIKAEPRYLRFLPFRGRGHKAKTPSDGSEKLTLFWLGMASDIIIILPLVYLLLWLWGVPASMLQLWTVELITGVSVGGVTISLFDFFAAVIVLLIGLFLTGVLRRWLSNKVLPNTKLDYGARNSVASGAGYLGVGLAMLMAISTLGVDFSNLALVAGALSVGIGFGLRTVVENFVAGLLILIERPIKVGDWIIVGATEGTVKHISVRSTEIETFDRSAVIVPNSDLISLPVTNWTHKNRMARVIVPVGVAYGSDTERVAQVLLQVAKENQDVLSTPVPAALFMGFGESSLNFQLRCFVRDTDFFLTAMSDLHFAIDKAFREARIEVPFPQRDLHLRSGLHDLAWEGKRPTPETAERTGKEKPGDAAAGEVQEGEESSEEAGARSTPGPRIRRREMPEPDTGSPGEDGGDGGEGR